MVDLAIQKRLASEILGVGQTRVWIDPEKIEEVAKAITREDIRGLIEQGVIKRKPVRGISRGRARERALKRAKGRRRGHGSRKGAKGARSPSKEQWMKRIRALRKRLRELRDAGKITKGIYRKLYLKAKGGEFRSVAHLNAFLKSQALLKEE
ncbi:MAG: 50S ribosomal protein L19e [Methanocellales archaeon]